MNLVLIHEIYTSYTENIFFTALSRVPVDALEIDDYEPDYESVRLSWRRVEVPPYETDEDHLTYMIEGSEPGVDDWRPLATGIPGTTYRLPDIEPTQDYRFRVRGLTPYGISPPSYPASMSRTIGKADVCVLNCHISTY